MLKTIPMKRILRDVALIAVGVILSASALTSQAIDQPAPAQDAGAASPAASADLQASSLPAAPGSEQWITCVPDNVAAYTTRIHVKCTSSVGGIWYYAADINNPAHAARILSVLTTAKVAGRTLEILYDPADTSHLPPGCAVANCRLLLAALMQ